MSTHLACIAKLLVAAATTWAVGASLYILYAPVSVGGASDTVLRDSSCTLVLLPREQSWYEAQGFYGLTWLALFCGLYLVAAWAAWTRKHPTLLISTGAACVLSIVTGFSIGGAYLPAVLSLFTGSAMLLTSRRLRSRCS